MFLRKTNMVPLTLARRKYPRVTMRELELAMNDSITFLIVRHPFERLLSAYRDKLMFALPHSLHDKLGAKIVRKYRKVVSVSWENKYYMLGHSVQRPDVLIFIYRIRDCGRWHPERRPCVILCYILDLSIVGGEAEA